MKHESVTIGNLRRAVVSCSGAFGHPTGTYREPPLHNAVSGLDCTGILML
jgi:hypothetical protein